VVGVGREPPAAGPRRGDVFFVALPDLGGHVLKGPHPAVVVQTDRLERSNTVVLSPMTSAPRSAPENPPYLVPVAAGEAGLPRDGYVKCDQLVTLPTIVLGPRVGRLNPEAIDRLDRALRFVLDL
jgi:mRNA-degrading endonuclease toxin of MazEF toxin-antitoxin module